MLIKLQGQAEIIRTDIITDVWVQFGESIIALLDGQSDSRVVLARYHNHPERTAGVFREIEKAMQSDTNELLTLPYDEEEEAQNGNTDVS